MSEIEFGDELDGLGEDLELLSEDEESNVPEKPVSSAPVSASSSPSSEPEPEPASSAPVSASSSPSSSPASEPPSSSPASEPPSSAPASSPGPTEPPSSSPASEPPSSSPASEPPSSAPASSPGPTEPPSSSPASSPGTSSPASVPGPTSKPIPESRQEPSSSPASEPEPASSAPSSSSPGPTEPPSSSPASSPASSPGSSSPGSSSSGTSSPASSPGTSSPASVSGPTSKPIPESRQEPSSWSSLTPTRTTTPTSVKDLFPEPNEFKVNGKSYLINEKGKLLDAYTRKLLNQNEKSNLNINPSEVSNKNVFRPLSIQIGPLKSLNLFLNKTNNLVYDSAGEYVSTLFGYLNLLESSFEKEDVGEKPRRSNEVCPPNKILNTQTGNCVLKTGRIGKKLMRAKEEGNIGEVLKDLREKRKAEQAPCRPVIDKKTQKEIEQLRAPDTNRCVRVDKPKGSRIIALKKIGLKTNQIRNILIREKNPVNEDYTYGSLSTDNEGRVRNPRTRRFVDKKGNVGRTLRRQRGKGRKVRKHKRNVIKMV
jgi:hypothetical protein